MSDLQIECFGGPLDGKRVSFALPAFPWPRGWYYWDRKGYRWRGDNGTYIPADHERWQRDIRPMVERP